MSDLVILGCGYTASRVALRWRKRFPQSQILATGRQIPVCAGVIGLPLDAGDPLAIRRMGDCVPPNSVVLHSIPVVSEGGRLVEYTSRLLDALDARVARMVYLSTTGVYGTVPEVDEQTPVAPDTERVRLRVAAEQDVRDRCPSSLILRPAAIYGPGRGVHESMRRGEFRLVSGGHHYTSRIHVDDLAALAEAALASSLQGAFPVADDEPCPSAVVARFCAERLALPMPTSVTPAEVSETRRSNRKVDGRAIRRLLGIELRYPSYRTGIPASIAAETAD